MLLEAGPVTQDWSVLGQFVEIWAYLDQRGEARVIDLAVVALQIILDDDLPVRSGVVNGTAEKPEIRDVDAGAGDQFWECPECL